MSDPRDTQFQRFAALLFEHLPWNEINIDMEAKGWEDRWERYLAQCAYDFVGHILAHITPTALSNWEIDGQRPDIPDITAWTKEQEG